MSKGTSFISGVIIGGIAGAAGVIAAIAKTNPEFQDQLKGMSNNVKDQTNEYVKQVSEATKDFREDAQQKLDEINETVKNFANDNLSKAEDDDAIIIEAEDENDELPVVENITSENK